MENQNIIEKAFDGLPPGGFRVNRNSDLFGMPDKIYWICFTPRSGSSWVTELLRNTQVLGNPEEWLNPNHIPHVAGKLGCDNLRDYLQDLMIVHSSANGVFGLEVTWNHLRPVLDLIDVTAVVSQPISYVHLIRGDFVAQAVSLYKATETGVFHSVSANAIERIKEQDRGLRYDAMKIKHWIRHLMMQEHGFEQFFENNAITPHRVRYEEVMVEPARMIRTVAEAIDEPIEIDERIFETGHKVIRTDKSAALAERFREEEAEFVTHLEENRGKLHPRDITRMFFN